VTLWRIPLTEWLGRRDRTRETREGDILRMHREPLPRLDIPGLDSQLAMILLLQPTADAGLVARILVRVVALEKPFFSWDHNHRDYTDCRNERYEKPKIIQPK